MLYLIMKELKANDISTLKSLWCILNRITNFSLKFDAFNDQSDCLQ